MEFIILESHFGLNIKESHSIHANTRNKCAQDLVEIIQGVASILYPEEEFEIYFLPSEPGSFKDVLQFARKHPKGSTVIGGITMVTAVVGVSVAYLTYKDSHESHEHDKKMWIIDDVTKCLELAQQKSVLNEKFDVIDFPQEKVDEVCQNLELQRRKNDRYQVLKNDDTITDEETTLKTSTGDVLSTRKITKENFEEYIEPVTIEEALITLEASGLIEILGPIVKQKREGGGIKWKGVYHGKNIFHKDRVVIAENASINFYMQDDDFKEKISNHEIVFKEGDNMFVQMEISFFLSDSQFSRKNIYVKNVERFNEDTIEHKSRKMQHDTNLKNQRTLFEGNM